PLTGRLLHQPGRGRGVAHGLQHLAGEHRLQVLCSLHQPGAIVGVLRHAAQRGGHRITTWACTAPAARRPSNTATTSGGEAPSARRPAATSCAVAPAWKASKPSGRVTPLVSACPPTFKVIPDSETTASPTPTAPPTTTTPVLASITILAADDTPTWMVSIAARNPTGLSVAAAGKVSCTAPGSIARAVPLPITES